MNAPAKVRHWQRQAKIRVTLIHGLIGLPLLWLASALRRAGYVVP